MDKMILVLYQSFLRQISAWVKAKGSVSQAQGLSYTKNYLKKFCIVIGPKPNNKP